MANPEPTEPEFSHQIWHDLQWRAVSAAFVINGFLLGAWASRVPAFKEQFDLQPGALGLLLLALAAGAIVSFPFAGLLSERWGAERLTHVVTWGYAPALVLLPLSPSVWLLGITLFVFGALHGAMDVAMNGWGAEVERRLNKNILSIFHAMFSLGTGLGATTGFVAAFVELGPLSHFCIAAVVSFVMMFVFLQPVRTANRSIDDGSSATSAKTLVALPSGPLFLIGLIAFSTSMGEGAMVDWSATFLREVTKVSEANATLGFVAFSATMVVTRLSGGLIVQKLGPVITTRISGAIAFVGLCVVIIAEQLATALVGFALVGVGFAVVMPLVFSRAANDSTMRPGPAIASVATLGYGGLLLGPPIVGFIAQFTRLEVSFAALAVLAVLMVLLSSNLRTG